MTDADGLQLRSGTVGSLPVIQHFLDKLGLDSPLAQYVPVTDRRFTIPPATVLGLLFRNIIIGRTPLYGLAEWVREYSPGALGVSEDVAAALNDDRAGRALDYLFDADRASLVTALTVGAIRTFGVAVDQLHNDSTSITFTGDYAAATGRLIRGKKALRITHGYNKDHRPDLKQLLWVLTVSADGAVPLHYRVCDGNTNDDPTHVETWDALCKIAGTSDFVYVADSKLCSRKNLDHIHGNGGKFICVLPKSRKEDEWFRRRLQTHPADWVVALDRTPESDSRPVRDVWLATQSPRRSAEGYRIIWVLSLRGAEHDKSARQPPSREPATPSSTSTSASRAPSPGCEIAHPSPRPPRRSSPRPAPLAGSSTRSQSTRKSHTAKPPPVGPAPTPSTREPRRSATASDGKRTPPPSPTTQ